MHKSALGWQFNLGTLFFVTALVALAVRTWPAHLSRLGTASLVVLEMALGLSLNLAFSGWLLYRQNRQVHPAEAMENSHERLALFSGCLGMMLYGVAAMYPFTANALANRCLAMAFIAWSVILFFPTVATLLLSLLTYPARERNYPLYLLRLIGLAVSTICLPLFAISFSR